MKRVVKSEGRKSNSMEKLSAHECQLAVRRERDRVRRHAKRTAEVWAMPADEVPTEEKGKYNTFFEVVEGYRKAIAEFKRCGCDWERLDPLARKVKDKTCAWIRRMHPEYVQYFCYQYCEWCRDAMIDQAKSAEQKARLQLFWKKLLTPRVRPPWERPLNAPMPRWP